MGKDSRVDVLELTIRNPYMTGVEVGRLVGISRERVRQLRNEMGLPTRAVARSSYCPHCGNPFPAWKQQMFCSRLCRRNSTLIPVPCEACGKINFYNRKRVTCLQSKGKQQHFWCDYKCRGVSLGKNNKGG